MRRAEWQELEDLAARARDWHGAAALPVEDLLRLDELYRRAARDLARLRARCQDRPLEISLGGVVTAAHAVLYSPPRKTLFGSVARYFSETFPRGLAAHWRALLLAVGLLLGGALASWGMIALDADAAYALAVDRPASVFSGGSLRRSPGAAREQLRGALLTGGAERAERKTFFSAQLFLNNLRVTFLAMFLGIFLGVPPALALFGNGVLLGTFLRLYLHAGIVFEAWAWVLPHAVMELGAVVISGAMGLAIARAVLAPGLIPRGQALARAGRAALQMLGGVLLLVAGAALAEAFLRQSALPSLLRLLFAGGAGLLLVGVFLRGVVLNWRAAVAGKI